MIAATSGYHFTCAPCCVSDVDATCGNCKSIWRSCSVCKRFVRKAKAAVCTNCDVAACATCVRRDKFTKSTSCCLEPMCEECAIVECEECDGEKCALCVQADCEEPHCVRAFCDDCRLTCDGCNKYYCPKHAASPPSSQETFCKRCAPVRAGTAFQLVAIERDGDNGDDACTEQQPAQKKQKTDSK